MLYRWMITGSIILMLLAVGMALTSSASQSLSIELEKTIGLDVPEPSGLTLAADGRSFWTVSDRTGSIYQLDREGRLLRVLPPPHPKADLEGISIGNHAQHLYLAEERRREIIQIDTTGSVLARYALDISGKKNSGLEGITWHPTEKVFYVLNEKKPALVLQLNSDFQIAEKYPIRDVQDISGIAFDPQRNFFWIISDENRAVFTWTPIEGISRSFSLPIRKVEGIAIQGNRLFLVSDDSAKLYEYTISE